MRILYSMRPVSKAVMGGHGSQPIPFEGQVFKVVELSGTAVGGQTRAPALKDDFPSGFGAFRVPWPHSSL